MGKQWIVEVVLSDGTSFGWMINYPAEVLSFTTWDIIPLSYVINSAVVVVKLIKNQQYDRTKDDLSRPTYP